MKKLLSVLLASVMLCLSFAGCTGGGAVSNSSDTEVSPNAAPTASISPTEEPIPAEPTPTEPVPTEPVSTADPNEGSTFMKVEPTDNGMIRDVMYASRTFHELVASCSVISVVRGTVTDMQEYAFLPLRETDMPNSTEYSSLLTISPTEMIWSADGADDMQSTFTALNHDSSYIRYIDGIRVEENCEYIFFVSRVSESEDMLYDYGAVSKYMIQSPICLVMPIDGDTVYFNYNAFGGNSALISDAVVSRMPFDDSIDGAYLNAYSTAYETMKLRIPEMMEYIAAGGDLAAPMPPFPTPKPPEPIVIRDGDTESCYRIEPTDEPVFIESTFDVIDSIQAVEGVDSIFRCEVTDIEEYALPVQNSADDVPPIVYKNLLTCRIIDPIYGDIKKGDTVQIWYNTSSHGVNGNAIRIDKGAEYILFTDTYSDAPDEDGTYLDHKVKTLSYIPNDHYTVFRFMPTGQVAFDDIFIWDNGYISTYGPIFYWGEEGGGASAGYYFVKDELLRLMEERDSAAE